VTSLYVRRTDRIHPLRPHIADTEHIDGDATPLVRPYLPEHEHTDLDDTVPCWIGDTSAGSAP
jgi:hypothetical protein